MISHWVQRGVQAGWNFPFEHRESMYPIHILHPLKVQPQERKIWSCLVTDIFAGLHEKTQLLADLDILSFLVIFILTFCFYLRNLKMSMRSFSLRFFFFKANFLPGSEIWINSSHSCWDNCLFSLAAWWQASQTVKQSPSTSPSSQHWCSGLGSPVHSEWQESTSMLGNALCLGTCLLTGSSWLKS